ncbi:hypothetical protein HDU99_002042, partial [Rhizoclosmatium hyalinum]
MFYHRILTCLIVAVTNALLAAAAETVSSKGIVNVYLLLDPQTSQMRLEDLAKTAAKKPFNRVTLAFLRPDMYYVPDSNTLENADIGYSSADKVGFNALKTAVAAIQKAGVEVFLSMAQTDVVNAVQAYPQTLPQPIWHPSLYGGETYFDKDHPWNSTANTTVNVTVPGDAGFHLNKRDPYEDIVHLAKDLDVTGIDLDYEEFWHADMFKAGNYSCGAAGCTLWQTTYKYAAIVTAIQCNIKAIHPSLKMSIAAAAA